MRKTNPSNVFHPDQFNAALQQVLETIHSLMACSREQPLNPAGPTGDQSYSNDQDLSGFEACRQLERPSEYLSALLDIIRVNFEPNPLGTMFLNSNLSWLYDAIPARPFQLGYVSLASEDDEPFEAFWQRVVVPHLDRCGYDMSQTPAFAVVITGDERYDMPFVMEVHEGLDAYGFVDEEAVGTPLMAGTPWVQIGCCLDPALHRRFRLSLWLLLEPQDR
ncbi:MAG: hypothetical protein HWE39_10015 [Oceanospirillaceae bacterium]|nr:hypothetical protein [Oceanospirillaceae bacterium]